MRFSKSLICRASGDFDRQLLTQEQRKLIAHLHLAGIGSGDGQHIVVGLERNEVVAEHQVGWNGAKQFGIDALLAQIDEGVAVAFGQLACDFALVPARQRRR